MGLLTARQRRHLAERGARLLRSKREALAGEFFRLMRGVIAGRERLEESLREATRALTLARATEGDETLASLALAVAREIPVEIEQRKVWGVPTPEVTGPRLARSLDARGLSPLGWGFGAIEATKRHEEALEILLDICSREVRLKRLGEEIRKTSRRINALEQSLIPRLDREIAGVESALEERAREDIVRLKRFKAKRERRA
jgi:V/A-type H+-transporting ATPase subunit D